MSNTSYETHSEAQQSGFAVERTSSGESELSSSLTEANDSEHSDARETRDDPSLSVRSQRGGIDFVRALTDPSAQLQ